MPERLNVYADAASLSTGVAAAFVDLLSQPADAIREIALTGGSVARQIHRAIAQRSDGVDWPAVRFWWGDERFVPADSPDRNAGQCEEDLLDHLIGLPHGLPPNNIIRVPAVGEVDDVQAAADAYADLLRHHGSGSWDLVMLGLGPDGHIASLFPHHRACSVKDAITVAVHDSPKPPPERVSLTFEALARNTKAVWFLVSGAEKAEAVARSLDATQTPADAPARGLLNLLPEHCEVVWWLDEAAAAALR